MNGFLWMNQLIVIIAITRWDIKNPHRIERTRSYDVGQNLQWLYYRPILFFRRQGNCWILSESFSWVFFQYYLIMSTWTMWSTIYIVLHDMDTCLWQQDGASAHYGNIVRNTLDNISFYRDDWSGDPIEWSPRSPDLSSMDFFLWRYTYTKQRLWNEAEVNNRLEGKNIGWSQWQTS